MSSGPEDIAEAISRLRAGGVVAFPTETVYGLGADAFEESAVRRVFALKGRPPNNPLIVHVSGIEMAWEAASGWPQSADALARRFWPGPLTLVLPRGTRIPAIVTGGGSTVAVRAPCHPLTLALIDAFGRPIVGPSANPSGSISPTRADHVRSAFAEADVFVLDGGPCVGGIESTVISLVGAPRVLRPGLVLPEEIAEVLGVAPSSIVSKADPHQGPLPSPGLLARHYAPSTPARLFDRADWPACRGTSPRVAVISIGDLRVENPDLVIPMPVVAREYAALLYSSLRDADTMGAREILIEHPRAGGAFWDAIRDRLRRAAHRE